MGPWHRGHDGLVLAGKAAGVGALLSTRLARKAPLHLRSAPGSCSAAASSHVQCADARAHRNAQSLVTGVAFGLSLIWATARAAPQPSNCPCVGQHADQLEKRCPAGGRAAARQQATGALPVRVPGPLWAAAAAAADASEAAAIAALGRPGSQWQQVRPQGVARDLGACARAAARACAAAATVRSLLLLTVVTRRTRLQPVNAQRRSPVIAPDISIGNGDDQVRGGVVCCPANLAPQTMSMADWSVHSVMGSGSDIRSMALRNAALGSRRSQRRLRPRRSPPQLTPARPPAKTRRCSSTCTTTSCGSGSSSCLDTSTTR